MSEDVSTVFSYIKHILQLLYKVVYFLENLSLSYMTRGMRNYKAHPLFVINESDEFKEKLNDLEIDKHCMCAPKFFATVKVPMR